MAGRRFHTAAATALFLALGAAAPAQETAGRTFYRDILPVFQKYCIDCHRVGGSAPQSLETYDLARSWLRTSRRTMREKSMPPWFADPAVGHWKNANLPTEEEISLVADWVKDGAEPGTEADAPAPLDYSAAWRLGDPDVVLEAPEAVEVPASSTDIYRTFVLDPGFTEDTWLSAIELKPGAASVVRELSLSALPADAAGALAPDGFDPRPAQGGRYDLAVWNRGMTLVEPFPAGTGVLVPAGWKLVLQAHYKSGDKGGSDRTRIGLHRADAAPAAEFTTVAVEQREISIPPDSYDFKIEATTTLEKGLRVDSLLPRMHYLGLGMEAVAVKPDGASVPLIRIQNYDYRMQTLYSPAEPIDLPAGTRIEVRAYYENSMDNPHNPNKTIETVAYGPAPAGETASLVLRGAPL